jgi:hypothetical protein
MKTLMSQYLKLWGNEPCVKVNDCIEFERRLRMIVSDGLLSFSYESVRFEFLSEWTRIRMNSHYRAPPNPPPHKIPKTSLDTFVRAGGSTDKFCWRWNDGLLFFTSQLYLLFHPLDVP